MQQKSNQGCTFECQQYQTLENLAEKANKRKSFFLFSCQRFSGEIAEK